MRRLQLMLPGILLAACTLHTGSQPNNFDPAHSAPGIRARLTLATRRLEGELLEVSDSGLVVHAPEQLVFVMFPAIVHATFEDSDVSITNRRRLDGEELYRLRMLSRFPYGIPADALRTLLVSEHQDTLAVVMP